VSVITQDLFSPPLYERWESVAELTCHLQGSTPYGKILSHNFQAVAHLGCSIEGSSPYRGTACKGVDFNGISIHIWEAVQWINAGTVPDKRTWSVAPKALRLVETFAYRNSKSLRLAGSFTNRIPCGKYPDWPLYLMGRFGTHRRTLYSPSGEYIGTMICCGCMGCMMGLKGWGEDLPG
jgi:hypothetical protein